ncbi:hypothetical protein FSARC_1722 [Fusarium sarcochroum]|uniref:SET domain-containing protein n=1 Tax=Fusarium sarcochroum TaxID=1208366 RepID=A0A8H4U7X0_9HYPO|nr:hypothetical protein FSARC_1722 [Fusarium sarcochroum]
MSSSSPLSIDALPTWARFNDVEFVNAKLQETDGKGIGLVAASDLRSTTTPATEETTKTNEGPSDGEKRQPSEDDTEVERARTETSNESAAGQTNHNLTTLLRIPHDLILSSAAIEEYTKVDQNFRQLIESAGHQFLPRDVPVPTMWSEVERALLQGTSLEVALEAKLSALNQEFDELTENSSGMAFWNSLFWEKGTATIQDWILVDAWYRSRCLELPRAGHAMVPGLDMANHSHQPTAYYEEDDKDDIVLLLRPGAEVTGGEEVTISYGEKSPAEMLFSYGFIDRESTVDGLTLPLEALPDDPLGKAKVHILKGPPSLKLSRSGGEISWQSPFAYLMCLNEEDGLEFRVLQGKDGGRELKLFWQEEDVTARADDFENLIKDHPLCQIFKLRVVSVLHEVVSDHLMQLSSEISHDQLEPLRRAGLVRDDCLRAAETLREIEASVLGSAAAALDEQVRAIKHDFLSVYLNSQTSQ